MKKTLPFFVLVLALSVFSSCKKCYDCVLYEYCAGIHYVFNGTPYTTDICAESQQDLEEAIHTIQSNLALGGTTSTVSRYQKEITSMEQCGRKKDVEKTVESLENNRYVCTEQ